MHHRAGAMEKARGVGENGSGRSMVTIQLSTLTAGHCLAYGWKAEGASSHGRDKRAPDCSQSFNLILTIPLVEFHLRYHGLPCQLTQLTFQSPTVVCIQCIPTSSRSSTQPYGCWVLRPLLFNMSKRKRIDQVVHAAACGRDAQRDMSV